MSIKIIILFGLKEMWLKHLGELLIFLDRWWLLL